jgi:hypothetical protein
MIRVMVMRYKNIFLLILNCNYFGTITIGLSDHVEGTLKCVEARSCERDNFDEPPLNEAHAAPNSKCRIGKTNI